MTRDRIGRRVKVKPKSGISSGRFSLRSLTLQPSLKFSELKRRIKVAPADDPAGLVVSTATRNIRFPLNWKFWTTVATIAAWGTGTIAAVVLLRLPAQPKCQSVFWPAASASLRLYCAQVAANQRSAAGLLEAIALINALPQDHPLRPEINRLVELWSENLLDVAEETFQEGKLQQAIRLAQQVPKNTKAQLQVGPQIKRWRKTWAKAEEIDQRVEELLQQQNWRQAFGEAVRLTLLDNRYWKTARFEVLSRRIMQAQEDEGILANAQLIAEQGNLEGLLKAMQMVQQLGRKSYFYQPAQRFIAQLSQQMLDLAESLLARRDLQGALAAAQAIPGNWDKAQDFVQLAYAQSWTWGDSVMGLEEAITQARTLGKNRPLYLRAQGLIARWQLEIEALQVLNQARGLVQTGSIEDLRAAINQAAEVPRGNPRWPEVQQQINQWQSEIETIQDRPLLAQADQLAIYGDLPSLNSAIRVAGRIQPGRSLYGEAQGRIQDWRSQIQAEKARQRPQQLFESSDPQARQLLQEARREANRGSSQALATAIAIVNQVSDFSESRIQADQAIDQWSQKLLAMARQRARSDIPAAIAIAQQVPSFTGAHAEAQFLIQEWRQRTPRTP